jgi:hypothetical protein
MWKQNDFHKILHKILLWPAAQAQRQSFMHSFIEA